MLMVPHHAYTVEEYLAFTRNRPNRYEYLDGDIRPLLPENGRHVLIIENIADDLRSQLKADPCQVYSGAMRLKVSSTGLYTYPDVMVVCGEPELADSEFDMLLNPNVIFEVLSKSTEEYDRKTKLAHYRTIPSLMDYVLVAQHAHHLTQHLRQQDGAWTNRELEGPEGTLTLDSIGCKLELREIYRKVGL